MKVKNLYSKRAEEQRRQFNRLINSCNMVLMNNIPEVDPSVWENWEDKSPIDSGCYIVNKGTDEKPSFYCEEHRASTDDEYQCEEYYEAEVCQWFAVGDFDADFLKRHNQYITYSDMLDTYFLAITHCGTSWDYTSMVNDFDDCYTGLEEFDDTKEEVIT